MAQWSRHIKEPGLYVYRRCTCWSPAMDWVVFTPSFIINREHPKDHRGALRGMHNVSESYQRKECSARMHKVCKSRPNQRNWKYSAWTSCGHRGLITRAFHLNAESVMNIGILSDHAQGTKHSPHLASTYNLNSGQLWQVSGWVKGTKVMGPLSGSWLVIYDCPKV